MARPMPELAPVTSAERPDDGRAWLIALDLSPESHEFSRLGRS